MLAAKSAQFLQAFARIGLIPDAGGTWILPRLVGEARARALMMLADPIGAEEAEAWGMIYRAVDDEDLMGEARTLAERLAAGPTHALGLIKRALAGFARLTASTRSSTSSAISSARPGRRTNIAKASAPFWRRGPRISSASGPAHDASGDRREVRRNEMGGRRLYSRDARQNGMARTPTRRRLEKANVARRGRPRSGRNSLSAT